MGLHTGRLRPTAISRPSIKLETFLWMIEKMPVLLKITGFKGQAEPNATPKHIIWSTALHVNERQNLGTLNAMSEFQAHFGI